MIRTALLFSAIGGLFGCADETLSGYGAADVTWVLAELDGQPFTARATLSFPEEGTITGKAPCNNFHGAQSAPYPWFAVDQIATTRMACPDLDDAEHDFLNALKEMTLAEVAGNTLLLSNDAGRKMVFEASN